MKRYKIFISSILLLIMVVFLFSFSVSAAEETYSFSLKQLVDSGSLDVTLVGFKDAIPTYTSVIANTSHWTEAIRYYPSDSSGIINHYGLEIYSNDSNLLPNIGDAKVVNFSVPGRFTWACSNFYANPIVGDFSWGPNRAKMRIGFRLLLNDGTFKYFFSPWVNNNVYLEREPSFGIPALEFPGMSFDFVPPDNAQSIYSTVIEMEIDPDFGSAHGSVGYVMMWGGKATFNLVTGSLADAPIYAGPETESYDEYHAMEDDLLGSNDANKEQVDSFLEDFSSITPPSSQRFSIIKALNFWQSVINDNLNSNPIFNEIIIYVLSIGLVVFVLSTGIINSFLRSRDKEEFQQIRNEKREYFKARTEYFKSHTRRYK